MRKAAGSILTLDNIRNTRRIAPVVANGSFLPSEIFDAMLEEVKRANARFTRPE